MASRSRRYRRQDRRDAQHPGADRSCRRQHFRARSRAAPGELTPLDAKAVVDHRGRARQAARAAGLRRAASGRAHVAQPAEVRRQRRSRPLHHPAPAGEDHRRHADQRTVADRVSGRGLVRPQDQAISISSSSIAIPARRSCRSLYLDNIVKYVRDGGALLMAAGPEFGTPEGLFYHAAGRNFARPPDRPRL